MLGKLNSFIEKNQTGHCSFTPHRQINSKHIKNFKVIPETIKLLEEYTGENFLGIGPGNNHMALMPKAPATRANILKVDTLNWEVSHSKGKHQQSEMPTIEWEEIFASHISGKGISFQNM